MGYYQAQALQSVIPNLKMDPSYKVDEGYSEDTKSQDGLESPMNMDAGNDSLLASQLGIGGALPPSIMALNEAERTELAYKILRSVRVASVASVVDRLWPCFHKDPIQILPPEIMAQIFSYLTPSMLLEASRASRSWREGILDSRLWRYKFRTEGWGLDTDEIGRFEKNYNLNGAGAGLRASRAAITKQKGSMRADTRMPGRMTSPRQPQGRQASNRKPGLAAFPRLSDSPQIKNEMIEENALQDVDDYQSTGFNIRTGEDADARYTSEDQDMKDVGSLSPASSVQNQAESFDARSFSGSMRAGEMQSRNERLGSISQLQDNSSRSADRAPDRASTVEQPLMLFASPGCSRLNYHYVFKQKRKLEDNWTSGQYRSFQLPHRDHPEDAHTECVYTIQYSGKYLVSGSRDRTLRIWDLDTERLVTEPLQGHTGSVLCLQFDHREEEDIIISGSSDTHVILWQFSTGKMLKQLTNAHRESVLNLKFDKRFLVTCSKDKTIKIWNRHELRPGDRNYPVKGVPGGGQCPAYIIDMHSIVSSLRNETFDFSEMTLEPYTHLMTLDLHGAAVNAIQIYKDELVSASGDRNLRVWNIHTGECSTKIEAHAKGIACVQYDGKRIVSGSSDNSIRIWDPASKTEVARLDGHNRLVRTIQAAFADPPGGREGLEAEAEEVKRQWQAASMAGLLPLSTSAGRQPRSVPGSRKPKDIRSVGAKIPPSGGGSKWGRIVSGSYDETVIIWKKTDDDEWVIGHRLRQEEALRAAGPPLIPRSDLQAQAQAQNEARERAQLQAETDANTEANIRDAHDYINNYLRENQAPPTTTQVQPTYAQVTNIGIQASAPAGPSIGPQDRAYNRPLHAAMRRGTVTAHPSLLARHGLLPSQSRRQQQPQPQLTLDQSQQEKPPVPQPEEQQASQPQQPPHLPPPSPGMPQPQSQREPQTQQQPQPHSQPQPQPQQAPPPRPPQPPGAPVGQPNARVFKLQFDARRIICCSQDPKIVGWDFANGDESIIECCRFFAAPQ